MQNDKTHDNIGGVYTPKFDGPAKSAEAVFAELQQGHEPVCADAERLGVYTPIFADAQRSEGEVFELRAQPFEPLFVDPEMERARLVGRQEVAGTGGR